LPLIDFREIRGLLPTTPREMDRLSEWTGP
jgi:hypothetical protein